MRGSVLVTCLAMAQNLFSRQSKDICTPIAKNRKHTHTHVLKTDAGQDGLCRDDAEQFAVFVEEKRRTGNQFDPEFTSVVSGR